MMRDAWMIKQGWANGKVIFISRDILPPGSRCGRLTLTGLRPGSWETPGAGTRGAMKTDRGSREGQKISPHAVAEQEGLRHKKTPTVGGA
jgi:hypothetical protein